MVSRQAGQDAAAVPEKDVNREDADARSVVQVPPNRRLPRPPMPLLPDHCRFSFALLSAPSPPSTAVEHAVAAHTDADLAEFSVKANYAT